MAKFNVLLLTILVFMNMHGMQDHAAYAPEQTQVYAIPGLNGAGCDDQHVVEILGEFTALLRNPAYPDLGQGRCLRLLRACLKQAPAEHKNIIVYAVSQGTATILNHLAETNDPRIKCVILQAPLVSGNSAILHTVGGPFMNHPWLAKLPLAHYWIPYVAKLLFPFYWPAGRQPIKSLHNIRGDIPIVISHARHDPQLSYDGACALYYGLRSQGKQNVYFISHDGGFHMYLLNRTHKPILDAVLAQCNLRTRTAQTAGVDLRSYQPDHTQYKALYDNLIRKERIHERLAYAVPVAAAAGVIYLLRHKIGKLLQTAGATIARYLPKVSKRLFQVVARV
jgi:hypothetical protein